jgi:hypothetical protein
MIPLKISSFTGVELTATAQRASEGQSLLISLNLVESAVEQQGASSVVYTQRRHATVPRRKKSALKVIDALCTAQDDSAIKMRY